MKNTPENKAKFFALYWGQKVLTRPYCDWKKWILGEEVSVPSALSRHGYDYKYFLELTPLSQITDKDAIEISNIVTSWDEQSALPPVNVSYWIDEIMTGNCATYGDYVSGNQVLKITDHLRSKGYALPWMGISVENLVEWKWVKLKEVSK